MSDLEVCKRIAEIEGAKETLYSRVKPKELTAVFDNSTHFNYNPLTDDALCFALMVKYKVLITWNPHLNNNCTAVIDGTSKDLPYPFAIADVNDESPNKAILLAIIEAHNNE